LKTFDARDFFEKALSVGDEDAFNALALELFHYQREHVKLYRDFISFIKFPAGTPDDYLKIPYLPVTFFRSHVIADKQNTPGFYFESSGTTSQVNSRHYIADLELYNKSLEKSFRNFYGDPSSFCFLFLLPSYLEREHASLVYMAEQLIRLSGNTRSGFFLHDKKKLSDTISQCAANGDRVFLWGVTFALLDFFETVFIMPAGSIILETGGMKGRRKEMIREEIHAFLQQQSGVKNIHSEYGMTELLSQAYSVKDGIFYTPPWMKVHTADQYDPFSVSMRNDTGVIRVTDLANIHSCAFIETQDLGRMNVNGGFEILGRVDYSEMRGCNLMIT
jgi:hypothetical protein